MINSFITTLHGILSSIFWLISWLFKQFEVVKKSFIATLHEIWSNLFQVIDWLFKRFQAGLVSLWNSFFWFVLTLFFGLLQGWLILGLDNLLVSDNPIFIRFLIEGAIPFFSVAVISSLAIDYCIFSLGIFCCLRNPATFFAFILVPVFVIGLGVLLFLICYLTPADKLDIGFIFKLEVIIFTTTFVHAMLIKSVAFFKEECSRFGKP
ncbi:MAG: hypothetical protein BWK78_01950 [Thiotrichaceae bacterium IS1]|nr:MAG: hypothetical protein BWK78_01950 [Thiotrichaceae bacterium IS1]